MANAKVKSRAKAKSGKAREPEYQGLCLTCNHAPTCVRRLHHGEPVWQCEEFDDFQPVVRRTAAPTEEKPHIATSDLYKGLCCNCENNEFCQIPKTEGGVWHCEEYA
jgi:hypothetical protein